MNFNIKYDEVVATLEVASKENWKFVGWYLDQDYTIKFNEGEVFKYLNDIDLYPKYEATIKLDYVISDLLLTDDCERSYVQVYNKPLNICLDDVVNTLTLDYDKYGITTANSITVAT